MQVVMEFLAHIFIDILTIAIGGFILWLLGGMKKPLNSYIQPYDTKATYVGIGFWVLIAVGCWFFFAFSA